MLKLIPLELRPFLSKCKYSTQSVEAVVKGSYNKKTNESEENYSKPPGWDEAQPFESVPGPKSLPIIGNMFRLLPGASLSMMKINHIVKVLPKQYGPIVRVTGIFGRKDVLYLFDPNDMEHMFRSSGEYSIREDVGCLKYYREVLRKDLFKGYPGLINVHYEEWQKIRTYLNTAIMYPKTMQQYTEKLDAVAKDLVKCINHQTEKLETKQNSYDITDDVLKWSLESVAFVVINKRIGALDLNLDKNSDIYKFIEAQILSVEDLYYLEVLPSFWKYLPSKRFNDFVKHMDLLMEVGGKYVDETMNRYNNENVPEDEVSVLKDLSKNIKPLAWNLSLDIIMAGIDTTGRSFGSILYYLAKNPDKQNKLRDEIIKFLPNNNSVLTAKEIEQMSYLKAVIKEGLRMAPISMGNRRTTTKDLVIRGYRIPKNTDVFAAHFYTSYLTDKYVKNPEQFIPERWLRSNNDDTSLKNMHQFVCMPFGYGTRSCIGKRLANMEIEVGLVNMIRNYELGWNQPDLKFGMKFLYGYIGRLKFTIKKVNF